MIHRGERVGIERGEPMIRLRSNVFRFWLLSYGLVCKSRTTKIQLLFVFLRSFAAKCLLNCTLQYVSIYHEKIYHENWFYVQFTMIYHMKERI